MARVGGKLSSSNAMGYSVQQYIGTIARFLFVILMPAMGFLIDKRIQIETFFKLTLVSLILAGLLSLAAYLLRKEIIDFFLKFFFKNSFRIKFEYKFKVNRIMILSVIINLFFSLSFFVIYFLALKIPSLMTTFANCGSLVNGFGSIILIFKVEPYLANKMDSGSTEEYIDVISSFLIGRVSALLFLSPIIFSIIYFTLKNHTFYI